MFHISTSYARLILSNASLFFLVLICPAHAVCIIQCQMWRQRGWGCYTPSHALYTPASIIKQIARLRSVFTLSTVCVCVYLFSHHDLIHFPSVSHIFLLPSFSVNLILYPQMSLISPSFCFPQSSPIPSLSPSPTSDRTFIHF